ncbi:MAG: hypothetical protein NTW73_01075 [Candidatus Parcubacteria bacterium]|nr:hypothetical protein [Candidatus Parcubacteria bacterium]
MLQKGKNGALEVRLSGKGFTRTLFFPKKTEEQSLILSSVLFLEIDDIPETHYYKGIKNGLPHIAIHLNGNALGKRILWEITKILTGVFQKEVDINII